MFTAEPRRALTEMSTYGALFLGEQTCVPYGDKVIGTNHVLPTLGAARYTGGLWVGTFLKTHTYQEIRNTHTSAQIGRITARLSRLERFEGHARSGDIRARLYGDADADITPERGTQPFSQDRAGSPRSAGSTPGSPGCCGLGADGR